MSKQFKVICLGSNKFYNGNHRIDGWRYYEGVDDPELFEDGKRAEKLAFDLSGLTHRKWQVRQHIVDTSWREREERRFRDGTYFPVPWDSEPWYYNTPAWQNHFAHLSIERDTRIAFTPNQDYGLANRKKRVRPGSYLNEYFGNVLTKDEIREWVADFSVTHEDISLKIARTADEIEEVYRNGPRSCMDARGDFSKLGMHPVRAYAGPDLALAYLTEDPNDEPRKVCDYCDTGAPDAICNGHRNCSPRPAGKYSARAIIWPERKIYGRLYGDQDRLAVALKAAGYEKGNLANARLSRHEIKYDGKNAFVMPYIDGPSQHVRDNGHYLVVDVEGPMCTSQYGYVIDTRIRCACCNKLYQSNGRNEYWWLAKDGNNVQVCASCNKRWVVACVVSGNFFDKRIGINVYGDSRNIVHPMYVEKAFAVCEASKTWLWVDHHRDVEGTRLADGKWVHKDLYAKYVEDHQYTSCGKCGSHAPNGSFSCVNYGKCYHQADWTVVNDYVYHRSQLSRPHSEYTFTTWQEARDKRDLVLAERERIAEEVRKEAARQARSAAQRARRERERAMREAGHDAEAR